MIIAIIVAPTIAIFIGLALDRFIERKPKLISYLSHASAFKLKEPQGAMVFTHSIVIANKGRKSAKEVRMGHQYLPPDFNIYPSVDFKVSELSDGGKEIIIPTLRPGEQITISYLYYPPYTWDKINTSVKHADGFARALRVIPTPQYSKWVKTILLFFFFLGVVAFIYIIYELIRFILSS